MQLQYSLKMNIFARVVTRKKPYRKGIIDATNAGMKAIKANFLANIVLWT
jgi:hypothetical protein